MNRCRIGAYPLYVFVALLALSGPARAAENGAAGGFDAVTLTSLFCLVVVGFWAFSRIRWYRSRGPNDTTKKRASDAWKYLSNEPMENTGDPAAPGAGRPPAEGFDQTDFMDGARLLYSRLQTAWGARRLEELRPFVGDALFARFEEEARRDPAPRDVTVVLVEGTFAGSRKEGEAEYAEVLFKALLREGGSAPVEVRERWNFSRGPQTDGMWRLDAVAGVEAG